VQGHQLYAIVAVFFILLGSSKCEHQFGDRRFDAPVCFDIAASSRLFLRRLGPMRFLQLSTSVIHIRHAPLGNVGLECFAAASPRNRYRSACL